ncbi:hypothetical protein OHA77_40320 [Streptosporangium sp. NBC_01639]|uniref:hypothetical protein n=1 Tax=Streptosporangium sp. NBC_01639 TaxID=2975948 RepID=UPI00386E85A2|nr:hypothetical protein OHA77_40320 [Streptosporangium sp. NBC_01639]
MRGIRCAVAISRSAGASVTSRSTNSAASNVTADACELRARRRRCDGASTAARARQHLRRHVREQVLG